MSLHEQSHGFTSRTSAIASRRAAGLCLAAVCFVCTIRFSTLGAAESTNPTPSFAWQRSYGGVNDDVPYSLRQTSDGGFILAGYSSSPVSGNKTAAGFGNTDYYFVKLDAAGMRQWERCFGGTNQDVLFDACPASDGGFLLGGYSWSAPSGNKSATNYGAADFWVIKLDSAGNIEWERAFGGTEWEYLTSIAPAAGGGFWLGGYSFSGVSGNKTSVNYGDSDFWIIRIDAAGQIVWEKTYGGTGREQLAQLCPTADGGCIAGGFSASTPSGNKTAANRGGNDFWVVKLDAAGNIQWDQTYGGAQSDTLQAVVGADDGGYWLGGSSSSGVSGNKTSPAFGSSDYWVLRINATGQILWQQSLGGSGTEQLKSLCATPDGGCLVSGYSASGISGNKTTANFGWQDFWLVKLDAAGTKLWEIALGGDGFDQLAGAIRTADGHYVAAGASSSSPSGNKSALNYGAYDYWICSLEPFDNEPPQILNVPASLVVTQGNPVVFTAAVTGSPPLTYRWFFNGTPISGATGSVYQIGSAQAMNAGLYSLEVSNPYGAATGLIANLTVIIGSPSFVQQPQGAILPSGASWALEAVATGLPPLFYQWFHNGQPVAGATNKTLVLSNLQPADFGDYFAVVSNAYGMATSVVAIVEFATPPLAPDLSVSTLEGMAVQLALGNAGSGLWHWQIETQPRFGQLLQVANEIWTYSPNPHFNGQDSFRYVITDGLNPPATGTVTIAVAYVDDVSPAWFGSLSNFSAGPRPSRMAAIDLFKDGRLDIALINPPTQSISFLTNNGQGALYQAPNLSMTISNAAELVVADFNKDGVQDMAVLRLGTAPELIILTNVSRSGAFAMASRIALPDNSPANLLGNDLNRDNLADLAVLLRQTGQVCIYTNATGGQFELAGVFAAGDSPTAMASGPIDNDSLPDLAVASAGGSSVTILRNLGGATFASMGVYPAGLNPVAITVADLNQDNLADIAVANGGSDDVTVLTNAGNGLLVSSGSFGAGYDLGMELRSLAASDFNRDGRPDLVLLAAGWQQAILLPGSGSGSLGAGGLPLLAFYWGDPATSYPTGLQPTDMAIGDFNGDGLVDVLICNQNLDNLTLLINGYTPQAYDQVVRLREDTAQPVPLTARGGLLSYVITQQPINGVWETPDPMVNTLFNPVGIYTPKPDFFGTDLIKFAVTDGVKTSRVAKILLQILPVNDAPSFTLATNRVEVPEGTAFSMANFATNIRCGPTNEKGQSLRFWVTVADTNLFAGSVGQPQITPSGALKFTSAKNRPGETPVIVRLQDNGGAQNGGLDMSPPQNFVIAVLNVNDTPKISVPGNKTVLEDSFAEYTLWVSDQETRPADLQLSVTSSNQSLVADGSINFIAIGSNRVVRVPLLPDANGKTLLTFTVSDGTNSASATSLLTVTAVNDPPACRLAMTNITVSSPTIAWFTNHVISWQDPGPYESGQTITYTVSNSLPALFWTQPTVNSTTGDMVFRIKGGTNVGVATVYIVPRDNGGTLNGGINVGVPQSLTITVTPATP